LNATFRGTRLNFLVTKALVDGLSFFMANLWTRLLTEY
jgi:hypothetical protein